MKIFKMNRLTSSQRPSTDRAPDDPGSVYEQYAQAIYRYLYYWTGSAWDAEDLTAEVFIRMAKSLSKYNSGQVHFRSWLYQIARNLAIDAHRYRKSHPTSPLSEAMPASEMDPVTAAENHLAAKDLQAALLQINADQREVLMLRFIAQLSLQETAQIIHKSEDAVKGLQRRGLESLRNILER